MLYITCEAIRQTCPSHLRCSFLTMTIMVSKLVLPLNSSLEIVLGQKTLKHFHILFYSYLSDVYRSAHPQHFSWKSWYWCGYWGWVILQFNLINVKEYNLVTILLTFNIDTIFLTVKMNMFFRFTKHILWLLLTHMSDFSFYQLEDIWKSSALSK